MESSGMVVDTSIFIEFLRAKDKTKTVLFQISDDEQIYISSVTLYELLMGANTLNKVNDIKILTEDIPVLPFNEDVASKAAEIYHQLRRVATWNNCSGFLKEDKRQKYKDKSGRKEKEKGERRKSKIEVKRKS